MSCIFVLSLLQEKTNFTTVMLHLECCNKQGINLEKIFKNFIEFKLGNSSFLHWQTLWLHTHLLKTPNKRGIALYIHQCLTTLWT